VPSVDEVLTGKKAAPVDPAAGKESNIHRYARQLSSHISFSARKPGGLKRKLLTIFLDPTLLTFVVSAFWHVSDARIISAVCYLMYL
jgi:hypothetical protein